MRATGGYTSLLIRPWDGQIQLTTLITDIASSCGAGKPTVVEAVPWRKRAIAPRLGPGRGVPRSRARRRPQIVLPLARRKREGGPCPRRSSAGGPGFRESARPERARSRVEGVHRAADAEFEEARSRLPATGCWTRSVRARSRPGERGPLIATPRSPVRPRLLAPGAGQETRGKTIGAAR